MEKNNQPLVSVVIPCYNHEKFVQDSIQSVIDQTYENIELIIIDDGSKDQSVQKVQELVEACKKRFKRFEFRIHSNKGLCATLNEAIEWCNGEYFCSIASDDKYMNEKITKQVSFLIEHKEIVAVSSNVIQIDKKNKITSLKKKKSKFYRFEDIFFSKYYLPAPTAMFKMHLVRQVGGYNEKTKLEDLYMWLKISQLGNVYLMDEFLGYYRRHDLNFSSDFLKMCNERYNLIELFNTNENYKKAKFLVSYLNLKSSRNHGLSIIFKMFIAFVFNLIEYSKK